MHCGQAEYRLKDRQPPHPLFPYYAGMSADSPLAISDGNDKDETYSRWALPLHHKVRNTISS